MDAADKLALMTGIPLAPINATNQFDPSDPDAPLYWKVDITGGGGYRHAVAEFLQFLKQVEISISANYSYTKKRYTENNTTTPPSVDVSEATTTHTINTTVALFNYGGDLPPPSPPDSPLEPQQRKALSQSNLRATTVEYIPAGTWTNDEDSGTIDIRAHDFSLKIRFLEDYPDHIFIVPGDGVSLSYLMNGAGAPSTSNLPQGLQFVKSSYVTADSELDIPVVCPVGLAVSTNIDRCVISVPYRENGEDLISRCDSFHDITITTGSNETFVYDHTLCSPSYIHWPGGPADVDGLCASGSYSGPAPEEGGVTPGC